MLPGLGGVFEGKNFQLNCEGWKELYNTKKEEISKIEVKPELLRCGPVTGAVENIGYANESDFYLPYLRNTAKAGFGLCVGDGCPDEKLKLGTAAIKELAENTVVSTLRPGSGTAGSTTDELFHCFIKVIIISGTD